MFKFCEIFNYKIIFSYIMFAKIYRFF